MKKRIVKTFKGNELPPKTTEYTDDSGNPFEIDVTEQSDFSVIQLFVEDESGEYCEVLYLMLEEA